MYLLGLKYLEALPTLTQGSGTTIFLPAEATGVLGAVGAVRELLAKSGAAAAGGPTPARGATPPQGSASYQPSGAYQTAARPAVARVLPEESGADRQRER
jgi:hypothetical protein